MSEIEKNSPFVEQLRGDLQFIKQQTFNIHPNPYFRTPKPIIDATFAELERDLPSLDKLTFIYRLNSIFALIGDAHTDVVFQNNFDLPFQMDWIENSLRLIGLPARHRDLVGSELVSMNGFSVSELLAKLETLIPHENMAIIYRDVCVLECSDILKFLSITQDATSPIKLQLKTTSGITDVEIDPSDDTFTSLPQIATEEHPGIPLPLSRQKIDSHYITSQIGDSFYFRYDYCADDDTFPIADSFKAVVDYLDRESPQPKLVIFDFRKNGGGNSRILTDFVINKLIDYKQKAKFVVLIGSMTFSSAVINLFDLKANLDATTIGEPTAGGTESYGEIKELVSPNLGIEFTCSTRLVKRAPEGTPYTASVQPDILCYQTIEALSRNGDKVLETALEMR